MICRDRIEDVSPPCLTPDDQSQLASRQRSLALFHSPYPWHHELLNHLSDIDEECWQNLLWHRNAMRAFDPTFIKIENSTKCHPFGNSLQF